MIVIQNLTKIFGNFLAVDKVSFEVPAKGIFGFIGPNGAGKTTTIKILATLMLPDEGTAWVDGHCIYTNPEKVRNVLGYMPDYFGTYDNVTVEEFLEFFALAYHIPYRERQKSITACMELTDLHKLQKKLISSLSKGMKQRLCLAKTLLHDPKVLILDEPAAGLDPRARIEFRSLLKELRNMGKTIFISSHILTELSDVIDSVAIVEKGKVIVTGDIQSIYKSLVEKNVNVNIKIYEGQKINQAIEILENYDNINNIEKENTSIRFVYSGEISEMYLVVKSLVNADIPITAFSSSENNLEDIFMSVTKGEVS